MIYLLGAIIILAIAVTGIMISRRRTARKTLQSIRKSWGQPKDDPSDYYLIERYSNYEQAKNKPYHKLSEQTINDLDLRGIFAFIDRTTSRIGQQYLFKVLTEPSTSLTNPWKKLTELFSNTALREKTQVLLHKLSDRDAYHLQSLFSEEQMAKPKWYNLLFLNLTVIICLIVLSFKYPVCLLFLLIPITISLIVHFWNKNNTLVYMQSLPQLNQLMVVAKELNQSNPELHQEEVTDALGKLKGFKRKYSLISFRPGGNVQDELSALVFGLFEMFKNFFMVEVFALFELLEELKEKEQAILILFEYVGEVDTAISICSLQANDANICYPTFSSGEKQLEAVNIYHPLIPDCVRNSITIHGKSVLITGSNMSGKSTFLRTLTINSILAQTLHLCFADSFEAPILKVASSIRIDDNLFQGKSYYLQEVNVIGDLLKQSSWSESSFFVLDEVFRGTNTLERIAAAKAVLSHLNQGNNLVIVATHDLELVELLQDSFDLYHFTEDITNDELIFDHQLKEGPLTTRNAIKLLKISGYPESVIDEAMRLSKEN